MRQGMVLLIATVGFLPFVSSCKDLGTPTSKTEISGTYAYKAFDLSGVQVDSGTLVLRRSDSQLSGELHTGEGIKIFEGRVLDSAKIELYEPSRSPYTLLWGAKDDGTIRGDVLYDDEGPLGPRRIGTFRAERIGD